MRDWFKLDKKYFKISFYVVISACILMVFYQVVSNASDVFESIGIVIKVTLKMLAPIIYGLIIAYLLYKPCLKMDNLLLKTRFFGKPKHRGACKATAVILVNILFIVLLALFFYAIIPSAVNSIAQIVEQSDQFIPPLQNMFVNLLHNTVIEDLLAYANIDVNNLTSSESILSLIDKGQMFLESMGTYLLGFIVNIGTFVYNFVIGLILAIYVNLDLEHLRCQYRSLMRIVFSKSYGRISKVGHLANDMFLKYLIGKAECSLIIGVLYYIITLIAGVKYALLIALILTVTNMIPFFGPFIGAVPIFIFSLLSGFNTALLMMLFIVVVQQIDGNILAPKIIGNSVNLSGFWIIVSILVCGKIAGVIGMILAIPIFAILQTLIGDWIRAHASKANTQTIAAADDGAEKNLIADNVTKE